MSKTTDQVTPAPSLVEYMILEQVAEEVGYRVVDTVREKTAEYALKATVKKSGTYVAIPARSMKPVTVTVEQVTQVTVR